MPRMRARIERPHFSSPYALNPATAFKESPSNPRQIDQHFFIGHISSKDKPSIDCVFPDGESRTRRAPNLHHLGVGPRSCRNPLEEVENQWLKRVAHLQQQLHRFLDRRQQ
jgi:hypothetical protein